MSPIVAALSSIIPLPPTMASATQPAAIQVASAQPTSGKFAATLAAAKTLPATGATDDATESAVEISESESGNAESAVKLNPHALAAPVSQKKLVNSIPPAMSAVTTVSEIIPRFETAMLQVTPAAAPTQVPQQIPPASLGALRLNASQPKVPLPAAAPGNISPFSGMAAGISGELQPMSSGASVQKILSAYSVGGQKPDSSFDPGGISSQRNVPSITAVATIDETSGLASELKTGTATSNLPALLGTQNISVAQLTTAKASGNPPGGNIVEVAASGSSNPQLTSLDKNTLSVSSTNSEQTAVAAVSSNFSAGARELALPTTASASPPAVSTSGGNPLIVSAPILVAKINFNADQIPGAVASPQNDQATSASVDDALDAEAQSELPAQGAAVKTLTGLLNGPVPGPSVLNSAANLIPSVPARRLAPAKEPTAVPSGSVRTNTGSATPLVSSASSGASASGSESAEQNQNPFSVFFSSPGPGVESAAAVLPKMILPPNSTIHDAHVPNSGTSVANSQTNNTQSGNSQPSAAQSSNDPTSSSITGLPTPVAERDAASATTAQAGQLPAPAVQPALAPTSMTAAPAPVAASVAETLPRSTEPAATPQGSAAGIPAQTSEALPPAPVQLAQMISRSAQSEMRIGMSTSAFGTVEVRTVVHANDVGLVIGSEKGDLRTLLGNELPAITNSLQQQNLRLNSVNFMQGFAFSNNTSGGGGGNFQQRPFVPMHAPGANEPAGENLADPPSPPMVFAGSAGSLSILA
jgi:hypothetical protein